jgi:hypothetical protein
MGILGPVVMEHKGYCPAREVGKTARLQTILDLRSTETSFGRTRDIQGHAGTSGRAGPGRKLGLFAGASGHDMGCPAHDPFKGWGLAFRACHLNGFIGL